MTFAFLWLSIYTCIYLFALLFVHCYHILRMKQEVLIMAYKTPGFFSSHSALSGLLTALHTCQTPIVLRAFALAGMIHLLHVSLTFQQSSLGLLTWYLSKFLGEETHRSLRA